MKSDHKVGCRPWRKRLLTYVDEEMSAADRLAFEEHTIECAACREALEFHLRIEELLHVSAGVEPDPTFEDRIVAGVFRRLDAATEERLVGRPARPVRRLAVGRVAALAAALVLVLCRLAAPPVPERVTDTAGTDDSTSAPAPMTWPLDESLRDDAIVPARLDAARATVGEALRQASLANDFRSEFTARTAELAGENWPIEGLIIAAITGSDVELAVAAIRGAAELSLTGALPAIRRAALCTDTSRAALVALGALAQSRDVVRLERYLDDPGLADAAAEGLARSGTARAARALADACRDSRLRGPALAALLDMGARGVGELLRLRVDGDAFAAEALLERGLPTHDQILKLLHDCDDPEILAAVIPFSVECGTATLADLRRLLADPALRSPALEAVVQIGGAEAATTLLMTRDPENASAAGELARATLRMGLVRVLSAAAADGPELAAALARGPYGEPLVEILAWSGGALPDCLAAIFADSSCRPERRARAALALAEIGRLDAPRALASVYEIALVDDAAAVTILCAAVRAGAMDPELLRPLSRSVARTLLDRARVIARRWRSDGNPPHAYEQRRLSKLLAQAIPKL